MATYNASERLSGPDMRVSDETSPPVASTRLRVSLLAYPMRGRHAVFGWITWVAYGVPDNTGAGSGYPGVLTNITHSPPLYEVAW